MKILLASVLLLWSAAAFADPGDPVPWGVETPASGWLSVTFAKALGGATCWMPKSAFAAAAENGMLKMYALTKDSTVAGVTVYKAADCPGVVTKMAGQFMAGSEMASGKAGLGSMIVSRDDAQLARAKKSLAYAAKLLVGK
jgi:hypothetical protein